MRNRLEDIGRLLVLLESVSDHELFHSYHGRKNDFIEIFEGWTEERRHDFLHNMVFGLDFVHDKLCECVVIARGHDNLNEDYDK